MLTLLRPRTALHASLSTQIRTIRTLPPPIPTYVKRWDPTLYRPSKAREGPPKEAQSQKAVLGCASHPANHDLVEQDQKEQQALQKLNLGASPANRTLARLLRRCSVEPDSGVSPTIGANLWRAYSQAKSSDKQVTQRLTLQAWGALWTAVGSYSSSKGDSRLHLDQIYRDMVAVNNPLTDQQRAWHIESLLVNGKGEQALEEWEEHYSSASKDTHNRFAPEYLAFGVRLHALFGHVDQAQRLSDTLFKEHPDWDDSLLLSVFRAHTSSDLKAHHDQAKTIYHTLKAKENKSFTLEEYDGYLVGFLEARSLRSARQVFRDMVYDGTLVTRGSAEDVDEVLKRLHMIYRLSTNMESMTSIALFAMSFLPHAYHHHIFGDWMKSAVDHRAPEAAAQVLNLMFQRGHKPGAYHFNMLLHALLRSKSEENTQKAENIGWRMVEEARNTQMPSTGTRTRAENIKKRTDPSFSIGPGIATEIPAGNITTFALMMQHHTRLHQWEHVEYLARDLEDSAIPPNFAVMNVLMDNKCRQGAYSEVWSIYKTLSELREEDNGVFPNGASIRCLWKTLRFSLGDYATRGDPKMPTPRELLKETVDWWSMARSRFDAQRFRQGLVGIDHDASTRLILHCFSYTSDLAGSLVALHVLRHELGVYPTEKEAEILQRQMAWVDMASDSESVRSQFFHGRSNTRNRSKVAKLYQAIWKMRLNWMGISSKEYAGLPAKERGDTLLNVLSALVRCMLLRGSSPWVVEAKIDAARRVVGLPRLPTGDVDAYDVSGEVPEKD